ncbi:DUF5134 domain-containing protein [Mycobacterium sp.]|uniref:DUF5134 domain-containing protein n=1 Tax=Mycobacterium sp. TaxID=1785 RepID=UPI003C71EC92
MIENLLLRWVVTGLFVLSTAVYGFLIAAQRRQWTSVVSDGLHFVMAIAMAVMAWTWGAQPPTTGPAVFFLLAGVWFVGMAVLSDCPMAQRAVSGYHAAMMVATAWMYQVAHQHRLPGQSSTGPEPEMPAPHMHRHLQIHPTQVHASGEPPAWVGGLNWFWTAAFAVAAVCWTYRLVAARGTARQWQDSLATLAQAMTAAGMAIMFGVIVFHA